MPHGEAMTATTTIQPDALPATIRSFLAAHAAGDADTAIETFRVDAVVVDQGETFRGTDEVLTFLRQAGTEFTYTTELVGARRIDDEHWVALHHLVGDFPGGVADLTFSFTVDEGRIAELVIAG